MKKTILAISLSLLSLLVLSACKDGAKESETTEQAIATQEQVADKLQSTEKETENQASESSTTQQGSAVGGSDDDFFGVRAYKYRCKYYSVPYQFIMLVGKDAYDEWEDSFYVDNFYESEEMHMVSFIKHFNISREDFDKANEENIKVKASYCEPIYPPYEYPENLENYRYEDELNEVYDADLIYTFDNEKINAYYARPPQVIIEDGTNALGETVTERTEQAE